jgi:hypothetical protein
MRLFTNNSPELQSYILIDPTSYNIGLLGMEDASNQTLKEVERNVWMGAVIFACPLLSTRRFQTWLDASTAYHAIICDHMPKEQCIQDDQGREQYDIIEFRYLHLESRG